MVVYVVLSNRLSVWFSLLEFGCWLPIFFLWCLLLLVLMI